MIETHWWKDRSSERPKIPSFCLCPCLPEKVSVLYFSRNSFLDIDFLDWWRKMWKLPVFRSTLLLLAPLFLRTLLSSYPCPQPVRASSFFFPPRFSVSLVLFLLLLLLVVVVFCVLQVSKFGLAVLFYLSCFVFSELLDLFSFFFFFLI